MGVGYNPRIVTDGLVLCLDAANKRSYPGSGTTWIDKVGGNDGTLINGLTFSSDNGGSLSFDGGDDYVDLNSFDFFAYCDYNKPFTIRSIIKLTSSSTQQIFGHQLRGGSYGGIALQILGQKFRLGMFKDLSNNRILDSSTLPLNKVYDLVATFDGIDLSTGFGLYVNGFRDLAASDNSGSITSSVEAASSGPYIGFRGVPSFRDLAFVGSLYSCSIYNRALSAKEVLQNYEATKGRYA
jgi:hypothetical protein